MTTNWETVTTPDHKDSESVVRRIQVPGGWLYQVQDGLWCDLSTPKWFAPLFVPDEAAP